MDADTNRLVRTLIAIVLAFGASFFLSRSVFLNDTPSINPNAVATVTNEISALINGQPAPTIPDSQPIPEATAAPSPQTEPTFIQTAEPTADAPGFTPFPTVERHFPSRAPTTEPSRELSLQARFGQCLATKGYILYTSNVCPACDDQKEDLGEAMDYINEINCSENRDTCRSLGIRSYPAWFRNNQLLFTGTLTVSWLSKSSGCPRP